MPDFSVIIPHIINIALLYIALKYLLYKPVKKFMDGRRQRVAAELDRAKKMQEEATAITSQAQSILEQAQAESREIINQGARKAKEDSEDILRMAENKARELSRQALLDAEHEKEAYLKELENQVGDLAIEIAARILGREVKPEDNDEIIKWFFSQKLDAFGTGNGGRG